MDSSHRIKNHTLTGYHKAAAGIRTALQTYDAAVRATARKVDLYPRERDQALSAARTAAETTIRQHRQAAVAELSEMRAWSVNHSDTPPNAEQSARRSYYSVKAQAELSGMQPADALAMLQKMAGSVETDLDRERVAEYAAAARGRIPEGARNAVARAVESTETSGARYWGASVDSLALQIGWLDHHVEKLMEHAGAPAQGPDGGERPPVDTRRLDLWSAGLADHVGRAFTQAKQHAEDWSEVAAALPFAGSAGFDASGEAETTASTPASTTATDAEDSASSPAGADDSQAVG